MRRDPEEHRRRRQRPGRLADTQARKLGEQTGLDTLVVPAVNDVHQVLGGIDPFSAAANVMSGPPGEYGRKVETQRN